MSKSTYYIVGRVVGLKRKPNPHNFNRTEVTKVTVEDDEGVRYHGTLPLSLVQVEIGDRVKFKAEIARSSKVDRWFFFQRPRMAAVG